MRQSLISQINSRTKKHRERIMIKLCQLGGFEQGWEQIIMNSFRKLSQKQQIGLKDKAQPPSHQLQLKDNSTAYQQNANYNYAGHPASSRAPHHKKVMKKSSVPPTFEIILKSESQIIPSQAPTDYNQQNPPLALSNYLSNSPSSQYFNIPPSEIQGPMMSNISSIKVLEKVKKEDHDENKGRRFTFGIESPTVPSKQQNFHTSIDQKGIELSPVASIKRPTSRLSKSKSQPQVHPIFNRIKISSPNQKENNQPRTYEIDRQNIYYATNGSPDPSTLRPRKSILSRKPNDPRVGKIYRRLHSAHSQLEKPPISQLQSHLAPQFSYPSNPRDLESKKNKRIEDLIDVERYEKTIENGVVVFRSKYPVQVIHYSPPPRLLRLAKEHHSPEPKDYHAFKETVGNLPLQNSETSIMKPKSGVPSNVRPFVKGRSIKAINKQSQTADKQNNLHDNMDIIQCDQHSFNTLVTTPYQSLMNQIMKTNNNLKIDESKVQPYNVNRTMKKQHVSTIQQMLAQKVSNSHHHKTPQLILNMQQPTHFNQQKVENSHLQEDANYLDSNSRDHLVLYLMDRAHSAKLFECLNSVKERMDSLLTFRNEKQLVQQLAQTRDIYDVVYVIPIKVTSEIEKQVGRRKNCYVVEFGEGATRIMGNRIILTDLKYLNDVNSFMMKDNWARRKKNESDVSLTEDKRVTNLF